MSTLTESTVETLDNPSLQKVLIVGGGFAGTKAALELANASKYDVTLLSDQDSFRYYPMLYKTATGGSQKASNIALSEILAGKDINLATDTAVELQREKKQVKCASGKTYSYDILVVALGSVTNFFGITGLEENAYGIKTLGEAQKLRNHLHEQLLDEGKPDINYVVIGGGPTGVELAGSLPAYIKHIMKRHKLRDRKVNVVLVEALPRLMPRMSEKYSNAISKRLKRLGVKLLLNEKVLAETHDKLKMSGESLASHTVIWTAGVAINPFIKANKFNLDEHGKVEVDEFLQAEEDVFVLGDNAGTEFSGMAQTALHDGKFVAKNLLRRASGESAERYKPKKPIYITPAGRRWAAVSWGKRDFFGIFGWVLRSAADLMGYHDLEAWGKASKHWVADIETEHTCKICSGE
jgi:NADH:ubiquinone reductase (H+-translocating)